MRNDTILGRMVLVAAIALLAASPAPAPSGSPAASAPADKTRLALVACERALFYVWPDRSGAPSTSTYPPARDGDAFRVTGGDVLPAGGGNLTETTIDVVEPWGTGKHYWIASRCIV